MGFEISFMQQSEVEECAKVLSLAMVDNPLHVGVFQGCGEKERLEIEGMFVGLFSSVPGIVYVAKDDGRIIGVMRMKSCVGKMAPDEETAGDENDIAYRKSLWLGEWARRDPKWQHWHLGPIGVLPRYRKQGVGSALMKIFCDETDRCGSPAYLETDRDENVRFYTGFGFELTVESTILGVKNRFMERPALKK